jgi:hypothetical protein
VVEVEVEVGMLALEVVVEEVDETAWEMVQAGVAWERLVVALFSWEVVEGDDGGLQGGELRVAVASS